MSTPLAASCSLLPAAAAAGPPHRCRLARHSLRRLRPPTPPLSAHSFTARVRGHACGSGASARAGQRAGRGLLRSLAGHRRGHARLPPNPSFPPPLPRTGVCCVDAHVSLAPRLATAVLPAHFCPRARAGCGCALAAPAASQLPGGAAPPKVAAAARSQRPHLWRRGGAGAAARRPPTRARTPAARAAPARAQTPGGGRAPPPLPAQRQTAPAAQTPPAQPAEGRAWRQTQRAPPRDAASRVCTDAPPPHARTRAQMPPPARPPARPPPPATRHACVRACVRARVRACQRSLARVLRASRVDGQQLVADVQLLARVGCAPLARACAGQCRLPCGAHVPAREKKDGQRLTEDNTDAKVKSEASARPSSPWRRAPCGE